MYVCVCILSNRKKKTMENLLNKNKTNKAKIDDRYI